MIFDMEHGRCDHMLCLQKWWHPAAVAVRSFLSHVFRTLPMRRCRVRWTSAHEALWCREWKPGQQAEDIVSQLKYAPQGRRRRVALGIAHDLYRVGRCGLFQLGPMTIPVVVLLLETVRRPFENLEEIISVPGVDVAWIGTLRSDRLHGDPGAV